MKALLRRRRLWINGALALLLVAGVGVAYLSLHDDAGASSPGRIVRVSRGNIVSSVSASGSVASANSRDLAFGASGTVDTIKVQVGDKVKKGRLLATLDDASAQDALQSAQAALSAAEAGDTSTPSGYSSYVQAKAARDSAQRSLDGTELKAPFSGTIVAVNGSVGGSSSGSGGSSTSSGSTGSTGTGGAAGGGGSSTTSSSASSGSTGSGFITIADTTKLAIKGEFTESDVAKVKKGQQASVTFDAMQGTRASGKVTAIDQTSTTTNNVVQYGVTVTLTDPPKGLRIGATATVQVTTASAENVLYVPTAAVRTAGGQSSVTVLSAGKQVTKIVQTGTQGDQGTEIKSGLNEGDQVLIASTGTGTGGTGFPAGRFPGAGGGGGLGGGLGGGAGRGGGR
ncbi:HlyD family efflux transporter periplasmic adaptor subunit [Actinoallomurus bryophytorum]|uniref:Macrolide-specific efflux system membrane fusion protein n=1 Tax=Actinoallomurus bryophytorum TaxID=1490222 RepID=A0A543CFE1_9ACTN|nr:HlyD family efflux transporter periplasmic adaptor subunit [Actinoallomurus bryophytorum]TQL95804.1 macrolide-specific efflux system membrane fusion protein [Actinoallomurus bryophytorum]